MPFTTFIASPAIHLDPLTDMAAAAIAMTKKFISERGLVCYGGTALDYAARLQGGKIYDDEKLALPDLDFYSTDPLRDARDLADILWSAGFEETRVINALHVGTFRVDCGSNHFVADVGYCPVLSEIRTLTYESFKIVHPDYQRLDMHSALSFLYDNPPREVVFARINKDIERFNIINSLYPIPETKVSIPTTPVIQLPKTLVYTGATAYQIHMNIPITTDVIEVVSISPRDIAADNGWTVIAQFYPLINILPAMTFATSVNGGKFIIYDTSHRLLSIDSYDHTRVASKNHCMKMLLGWHLISSRLGNYPFIPSFRDSWVGMYSALLQCMTLSTKYYGDENVDHNSIIKAAEYDRLVLGITPSSEYALPMNYRPKNRRRDGEPFNYTGNIFFRVDGSKIDRTLE